MTLPAAELGGARQKNREAVTRDYTSADIKPVAVRLALRAVGTKDTAAWKAVDKVEVVARSVIVDPQRKERRRLLQNLDEAGGYLDVCTRRFRDLRRWPEGCVPAVGRGELQEGGAGGQTNGRFRHRALARRYARARGQCQIELRERVFLRQRPAETIPDAIDPQLHGKVWP